MSEEICCILGKIPKMISYVRGGDYIRAICKLKDDVDCFTLNEFFNMVYSVKLDIWDINFWRDNHSTADLIRCFHIILEENGFINLKDLCSLVGNFDEEINHPILKVVRCFFEMFDIVEVNHIPLIDFNNLKLVAINSDDKFYKEVESIFYNSMVMESLCQKKLVKVRKQS